jgi:RimJ/RimL family protein N-acetyltransferase
VRTTAAAQVRRQVRRGLVRGRLAGAARRVLGGPSGPEQRLELPPTVFPVRRSGRRVVLRELEETDADAFARLAGDPEVCRFMKVTPADEAAAARSLAWKLLRARQPGRSHYELVVEEGGRFAGTVTLHLIESGTAELGFWLLPEAAGKGLATDACATLLRFGADELGVHRVSATCDVENERAVALLERLGMVREGRMRHAAHTHLGWRDRLLYARLLDEPAP